MIMPSIICKGEIKMDKEKILEKARNENKDEGLDNAKNEGLTIGYKIFLVVNTTLILFNLFKGQNSYAIMSLFWGFIGAEAYSRYKFSMKKIELVPLIGSSIACIGFLINYILYSFR